jgi:predicted CoA-binding protein
VEPLTEDDLRKIYADAKTIAVVGASADESKPGHRIPGYLQRQGYHIIPVNPRGGELFGEPVRASLTEGDDLIDVVLVFRPSEEAAAIARDAAKVGAEVLWLQVGIESDEAAAVAEDHGMTFVSGRCMGVTHGELGLGPGPNA